MRPPRLLAACVTALLVACAAAPPEPPPVASVSVAELRSDPSRLPSSGYLSTGQPDPVLLEQAARAGYVAVVDLRTPGEPRGYDEAATVEGLGLDYVTLPVAGPDDVSWEKAAALDAALAKYDGPVLLHCGSGNRVGALFALRARANGATAEEAMAAGKAAGLTRLEGVVRERLAEDPPGER